jgi:hypothetical protein
MGPILNGQPMKYISRSELLNDSLSATQEMFITVMAQCHVAFHPCSGSQAPSDCLLLSSSWQDDVGQRAFAPHTFLIDGVAFLLQSTGEEVSSWDLSG